MVISHKSAQNHTESPHPAPRKACRFYLAARTPPRIDHYPTIIPWLGVDENTVLTNRQKISTNGVLQWSTIRRLTEEVMQRMTVKAASSETPIGTLSGGNQQKVVIGRWVYAASQILLLDEPTRGVDIEAKQQIYRIVRELAAEGKSVVFISSEVEELPLVCDRILLLQHGTFSQEFHSPVNVDELMSAILSVH